MRLTLEKRLLLCFTLTLLILIAEVIGGIISKSLALLSDAGLSNSYGRERQR